MEFISELNKIVLLHCMYKPFVVFVFHIFIINPRKIEENKNSMTEKKKKNKKGRKERDKNFTPQRYKKKMKFLIRERKKEKKKKPKLRFTTWKTEKKKKTKNMTKYCTRLKTGIFCRYRGQGHERA